MEERKMHLQSDLNSSADKTVYEVKFFIESKEAIQLYETLKTQTPPMIPSVGETVSFEFVTDDTTGDEVFRNKQGPISADEIASDGDYTKKHTTELEIVSVDTKYEKSVTKTQTTISKIVTLQKPR